MLIYLYGHLFLSAQARLGNVTGLLPSALAGLVHISFSAKMSMPSVCRLRAQEYAQVATLKGRSSTEGNQTPRHPASRRVSSFFMQGGAIRRPAGASARRGCTAGNLHHVMTRQGGAQAKHANVFLGPAAAAEPIPRVLIWLLCPFTPKAGANGNPKAQPNLRTFSGWQLSGSDIVERAEKRTFWVELPESAWQRTRCRGPSEFPRLRSGFRLRAQTPCKTAQLRLRARE
jgi:hypothetical protein